MAPFASFNSWWEKKVKLLRKTSDSLGSALKITFNRD